jgi:hypothetical protein
VKKDRVYSSVALLWLVRLSDMMDTRTCRPQTQGVVARAADDIEGWKRQPQKR